MIAVLMAVTYIPFWASLLPVYEYAGRFIVFGTIFFCVCDEDVPVLVAQNRRGYVPCAWVVRNGDLVLWA